MIELRPCNALGHAQHGWLNSRLHFSFADYHNPQRMHWGALRVWNDDEIAPGSGFPPHPHRDMEIITYVREGAISHRDNLGNQGRTAAGDVQVMSAGTGIQHAEYNREAVTSSIFQIWLLPDRHGHAPTWGTRRFPKGERAGQFVALASGVAGDPEALPIHAKARVLAATLLAGQRLDFPLGVQHKAYLVPARGQIEVNGVLTNARDGLAVSGEQQLHISARQDSEIVLVHLL